MEMQKYTHNTFEKKQQHGGRKEGSKNHDISTWSVEAQQKRQRKRDADKMRQRRKKADKDATLANVSVKDSQGEQFNSSFNVFAAQRDTSLNGSSTSSAHPTNHQQLSFSTLSAAPTHFHDPTLFDTGSSDVFPYATPPYSPPDPNFFSEHPLHPSNVTNLAFASQNDDDLEPLQPLSSMSPLRVTTPLDSQDSPSELRPESPSCPPEDSSLQSAPVDPSMSSTLYPTQHGAKAFTQSSLTAPTSTDFTMWQGKEYCPNAQVLMWPGGVKTKGPWCPDSRRKPHNLASHDLKYVSAVARAAELPAEGPYYTCWAYDPLEDDVELARRITRSLGQRKVVHLTNNPPDPVTAKLQWTDTSFHSNFGLALDREYEAIEAKQRTRNASTNKKLNVNHRMTIPEFTSMLDNDKEVHAILDAPVVQVSLPSWVKLADDGHSGYFRDVPLDKYRRSIPKDVQGTQSWFLIHMGRFHTFPHHDSNGLCTLIRILHGCKCWVYLRNPDIDDCQDREALQKALEAYGATDVQFKEGLVRFVIYCQPGDLLIQGPGVYHEVYTPIPTASAGGHFYTVDTMHLTEMTLWYSLGVHDCDTNHNHPSVTLTMIGMINGLRSNPRNDYPRKALAALCRIILRPLDYFATLYDDPDLLLKRQNERFEWETEEQTAARIPRMDDHNIAINNARLLARAFDLRMSHKLTADDLEPDFVLEGGLQDPGELIDIASIKPQLNLRTERPQHPIESLKAREISPREDE
ncbi:hypothetical protein EIP91_007123 [Steccherinum ochraceum]|uniref:JmjC domain-containing protein n=1 Tax=Steccherinum ochraceum TaxID=92696 RepID=A0A4R0RAC6_9APHY|nr:hypothetical protein EIP91_007123 [Steccherinum ochraceum]